MRIKKNNNKKNIQTYYGNENVWKKVFTFHENEAKKYIMVLKWVSFLYYL